MKAHTRWIVTYSSHLEAAGEESKDVKSQLHKHLLALHEYLHPVSRNIALKIVYFVVSNESGRTIQTATGYRNAELVLLGYDQLISQIASRFGLNPTSSEINGDPRRIAQSEFLDLLRLGHAHPHLGHPEVSAAIRYDLSDQAAHKLKLASDKLGFYLVAACDRHQKIMDAGADSKVIPGFNFSGKYVRLKKIYRNPAPIYIASLGLMFRWFASKGPKVVPSDSELRSNFGFETLRLGGQALTLSMKTDAHPGNSWSHSVARFNDASTVATLLRRERLNRSEVLWVRFSKEDRTFDYESLHREFTYHNCRTSEAVDLNDKYIKGQEYPVVVIEGFPGLMDRHIDNDTHNGTAKKMWKFRRELYLCASRATCFLFFVCNDSSSDEFEHIDAELNSLLQSVSSPKQSTNGGNGVRSWSFRIDTTKSETIAP